MNAMEPAKTSIRRPFHWGSVVIVGDDWYGEPPALEPDHLVAADDRMLIVLVRHAQDSDEYDGEDIRFAEVDVTIRRLDAIPPPTDGRREVFRGVHVPSGRLSLGDADDDIVIPVNVGANLLIVSVDGRSAPDDLAPEAIWLDVAPAL